jgi:hypothetical protein
MRTLINQLQKKEQSDNDPTIGQSKGRIHCKITRFYLGHVSITYIEPNSGERLTTTPVFFYLLRAIWLPSKQVTVNHMLDVQRNRIETAMVLRLAMEEKDYRRSRDLLKRQVKKIERSFSGQDPFCQQLIQDLQLHYPTEDQFRRSHTNAYIQHSLERSTYTDNNLSSSVYYRSRQQQSQMDQFDKEYYSKNWIFS